MNLATKADVENHFNTHGTGEITEIKLMNGFGFIEYKDAMDARDVVPGVYPSSARAADMTDNARFANSACSLPYVCLTPLSGVLLAARQQDVDIIHLRYSMLCYPRLTFCAG